MRLFLFFVILLNVSVFAQTTKSIVIKDSLTHQVLENVLVYNLTTKEFNYSNSDGQADLSYDDEENDIQFYLPGYAQVVVSMKNIIENESAFLLNPWTESLEEVVLIGDAELKSDYVYAPPSKKKRYIGISGKSPSISFSYLHKICANCRLIGMKIYLDSSTIEQEDEVDIRPIILDENFKSLIVSSNTLPLLQNQRNILISFIDEDITLEQGEKYYVGWEFMNKKNSNVRLRFQVVKNKNNDIYVRSEPNNYWVPVDDANLSLYYELYFKEN